MKAAAEAQRRLLDLQASDTAIAQLEHRRRGIPEIAELAAAQAVRTKLAEEVVEIRTRVSDLELEVAKAEADLVPVRERRERDRKRVDSGLVSDGKQLTALLGEIEHLGRRIGDLEDIQLEVMERLEASQGQLAELQARKAELEDRMRGLIAKRDAQASVIDADLAEHRAEREALASALPADLVTLYARVAGRSGGTGAALLQHGRCGGCQLEATNADLNRYRQAADDEVLRCEECDRILVRTPESGL